MEKLQDVMSPLDSNAERIFQERYAKMGETHWSQLASRVSSYVCDDGTVDGKLEAKAIEKLIYNKDFLPNSPCLMNAGTELAQLSACFVLPIQEDSMKGIFRAVSDMAEVQKCGGGTGFNFSILREKDSEVSTTKGKASGILSFMRVFNAGSKAVEQGGVRRGANMGIVEIDHPDFIDTIEFKAKINKRIEGMKLLVDKDPELKKTLEDLKELTYFNISAGMKEDFMLKAIDYVEKGIDSEWVFISRKTGKPAGKTTIGKLWDKICLNAWSSGDPGIIFLDLINAYNPVPTLPIIATNPCGEQPLRPYESCNLGSINLLRMLKFVYKDGKLIRAEIDYNHLEYVTRHAVRFLDSVIDVNYFPLPEIEEETKKFRSIGLGVMGVADMLYALGIRYGSKEAVEVCGDVMNFIDVIAREESTELGIRKGNFPTWHISIYAVDTIPMRNATRTTIAPTGSISILAGCSSGIEPNFLLAYYRTVRETHGDGEYKLLVINPVLVEELKSRELYSQQLVDKIIANGGIVQGLTEIPRDMQDIFITSFDVSVEEHIAMQAIFQKYTDNAVSKTLNMPADATPEDVSRAYILAFKSGCKGVTIYRDGSLDSQVLTTIVAEKDLDQARAYTPVRSKPVVTDGYTVKLKSGCCKMNVTIGHDENGELFDTRVTNSEGGCSAMYAGLGTMASEAMRLGGDPARIANQLRQITCTSCTGRSDVHGKSCPDILGRILEKSLEGKGAVADFVVNKTIKLTNPKNAVEQAKSPDIGRKVGFSTCERCGKKAYTHSDGCGSCYECGYSKCKS